MTTSGLEIDTVALLTSWLTADFSYTYLNSEYEKFTEGSCYFGRTPDDLAAKGKEILFGLGSAYAHADPGTLFSVPSDEGRPIIDPVPGAFTPHATGATLASIFLLVPVCNRLDRKRIAVARDLAEQLAQLLERHRI